MVSHSHSCGPVPVPPGAIDSPDWPVDMPVIILVPDIGRCVMPNPLARPRFAGFDMARRPLLELSERAASFDPVEFSGLSMSMPSPPALLLCLRWRLAEIATLRGREAAPGPGVDLGGAAAIGTTPFPPAAAVVPWKLVGLLPAVFPPEAAMLAGDSTAAVVAGGVVA